MSISGNVNNNSRQNADRAPYSAPAQPGWWSRVINWFSAVSVPEERRRLLPGRVERPGRIKAEEDDEKKEEIEPLTCEINGRVISLERLRQESFENSTFKYLTQENFSWTEEGGELFDWNDETTFTSSNISPQELRNWLDREGYKTYFIRLIEQFRKTDNENTELRDKLNREVAAHKQLSADSEALLAKLNADAAIRDSLAMFPGEFENCNFNTVVNLAQLEKVFPDEKERIRSILKQILLYFLSCNLRATS